MSDKTAKFKSFKSNYVFQKWHSQPLEVDSVSGWCVTKDLTEDEVLTTINLSYQKAILEG